MRRALIDLWVERSVDLSLFDAPQSWRLAFFAHTACVRHGPAITQRIPIISGLDACVTLRPYRICFGQTRKT